MTREKPQPSGNRPSVTQIAEGATAAYGLVPSTIVAAIVAALGYVASLPLWSVGLVFLTATASSLLIYSRSPSRKTANLILGVILAVLSSLSIWFYYNYKIYFRGIIINLAPENGQYFSSTAASADVGFRNDNKFTVYARIERGVTIIEGKAAVYEEPSATVDLLPVSNPSLRGPAIRFSTPLQVNEEVSGSIDYTVCYGRDKEDLRHAVDIAGTFSIRIGDGGEIDSPFVKKRLVYRACH